MEYALAQLQRLPIFQSTPIMQVSDPRMVAPCTSLTTKDEIDNVVDTKHTRTFCVLFCVTEVHAMSG